MLLTWFLGGYAIGVTFWFAISARQNSKLKSEKRELSGELSEVYSKLGDLQVENADSLSEIELLNKAIQDCDKVLYFGRNNLTWLEQLPSQNSDAYEGSIMVIGQDKESGFFFVVKVFRFNINDSEDRDFAIREAEELIEIINKF